MKLASPIGLLLAIFLLLPTGCSAGVNVYVDPAGNDAATGTAERPVASLEAARDLVRKMPRPRTGPIIVVVRGGTYRVNHTIEFTAADSGTADAPIVYEAAEGQRPIFTGGAALTPADFKPVTDPATLARIPEAARGHVLAYNLKAHGITDLGDYHAGTGGTMPAELFIHGTAMTVARWPNKGYARIAKVIDRGSVMGSIHGGKPPLAEKTPRGATFTVTDDHVKRWAGVKDGWMSGFWWWDWAWGRVQIASVDPAKNEVRTVQPHHYGFRNGARFYAFNMLEELDEPGEYDIDRSVGMLYVWPPAPLAGANVELSQMTHPLVTLRGTSHVTLRGLTFQTSRGTLVAMNDADDCRIDRCMIRQSAGRAVSVTGGKHDVVSRCQINAVDGGISLTGGDRRTLTPAGHVAEDNVIHDFARTSPSYVVAIWLSGVGNRASHNLLYDAPHTAILFGGNGHVIEFNDIHDVCRQTDDAGAIYSGRDWAARGNIIRFNYIHDIPVLATKHQATHAIYLDDAFSSALVEGNVIARLPGQAMLIGGGHDNTIVNNVVIDAGPIRIDDRMLGWMKFKLPHMTATVKKWPYDKEPWRSRYPKLAKIFDTDPCVPSGNVVERNVMVNSPKVLAAKSVAEHGTIRNNWTTDRDPGFVDIARHDYDFRPDAPAFREVPGFKPIPFSEIGPREKK